MIDLDAALDAMSLEHRQEFYAFLAQGEAPPEIARTRRKRAVRVMELHRDGLSNAQIASRLRMSARQVRRIVNGECFADVWIDAKRQEFIQKQGL